MTKPSCAENGRISVCALDHRNRRLADTAKYSPDFNYTQKLQLLETPDVVERLKLLPAPEKNVLEELRVRKRIHDDVEDGTQKQQRE